MIKNTENMGKEFIKQVGFSQIDNSKIDYNDGDIAYHTDIREFPVEDGSLKVDMFVVVACVCGKMQVEINSEVFILEKDSMMVCNPNSLITNCMLTPDFDGMFFCISQRIITESMSESDIWNRAFRFSSNPIVRISEGSLRIFKLYGSLLWEYKHNKDKVFQKEIITSIVRAALYEMLSDIGKENLTNNNLLRQSDILFKRFMELLTSYRIKPRTVSWYADQLCVTPKYLSTVCKQVSSKTAFDWINEYVEIDIKHMLKNTNLSIKEITEELNFPNMSFFGKYCRNHFGISPSEYRKQLREHSDEK